MVRKRSLLRRLSPIKLVLKEYGGLASFSQPEWLPKASGEAGVEAEGTPRHPLHHLLLDRKCVMEWEEPHDSTLYCLQTDGNHLLATGSSYYGVVRLWDRRQRACLHVSVLRTAGRPHGCQGSLPGSALGVGVPGKGGRKPRVASVPWHQAGESCIWAPPAPSGDVFATLVPPLQAFPLTSTPLSSPVYCLRFTTRHLYAALSYNLRVLDFQNP